MYKKKYIYIIGAFPPQVGGVATYNFILKQLLLKDKFQVEVIDFSSYSLYKFAFKLLTVKKNSIFIDSYSISIDNINFKRLFIYLFIVFFKRIQWFKIIHDGTFPKRYKRFSLVKKILSRLSAMFVTRIICVNNSLQCFLKSQKFPLEKINTIGSLLPFYMVFNIKNENKEKIIITSGAFTSNYSFKDVVLAYSLLDISLRKQYKLLILNTSFSSDDNYKNEILEIIKEQNLNIEIYENLDYYKTLKLFNKSMIYIRSVKDESFGLAKVESLLLGNQVITTPTGVTKYMTTYEAENYVDLFDKLYYCIQNKYNNIDGITFYTKLANRNYRALKEKIYD